MEEALCGRDGARLRLRPMFVKVDLEVLWEREIWPLATVNGRAKRGIAYSLNLIPFVHCGAVVLILRTRLRARRQGGMSALLYLDY